PWATLLAPYLTGAPQAAYRALSDKAAQDYQEVKEAILDTLDINPETFRRRFRGKEYHPGIRLRALAQELKDACCRWLQPDQHSKEELIDQVVMEQFLHAIPKDFLAAENPRVTRFYWPGVQREVQDYCTSCPDCQK
uniref:SCAN box domain-containing protein n=1 Tax=Pelusios castaneus TaxID=367368 RepID=A0A8C8SM29_9SAUR